MTNEEAIKMLTAKVECTKCLLDGTNPVCGYENCDDCDLCYAQGTAGDQIEALEKAIKALSRSEIPNGCHDGDKDINVPSNDCEYCHEDAGGYVKPIERNGHAFIHFGMNGWVLSLRGGGWHGECKIRYCPMCGRELKYE